MKTRKITSALKSYFYFNRSERRGVIALLILVLAVMLLPRLVIAIFPPPLPVMHIELLPIATDTVFEMSGTSGPVDINSASAPQLASLGFTPKQVKAIMAYRGKGGEFQSETDVRKVYGLTDSQWRQIQPRLFFSKSASKKAPQQYSQVPLELNTADSAQLVALYKIGPAMAHRILEYRSRLHGFVSLDQLKEIYGFDEDILYDLKGKIRIDPNKAVRWNLNTVEKETLQGHPYFKYKLSNAIVNYRNQHGPFLQLTDLKKIVLVNDSIYRNITQYLVID